MSSKRHKKKEGQFILTTLRDLRHLKNSELEQKFHKYKGRVVLRGDVVKDDSGSYAVFTEQGSSASQMTARESSARYCQTTWMCRTNKRRSFCLPKSKSWRLQHCPKLPSLSAQTSGYVYHDTSGRNHGTTSKSKWFSKGISTDIPLQELPWERQFEKRSSGK